MYKFEECRIVKTVLKKKNKSYRHQLPNFGIYYYVTVIKTVQYWHKDRRIDQWNRIESLEIDPHFGQFILNKGAKTNGERIVFSTNGDETVKSLPAKE